jgi:hypothetical protein
MTATHIPRALFGPTRIGGNGAVAKRGIALNDDEDVGGARLLLSDARVALILVDEARDLAVARLFGVPRDKALLVTIVGVAAVAQALHDKAARFATVSPQPSLVDTITASAFLDELVHGIAGTRSRDTPFVGALVVIAILGATVGPVAGASVRAVKASSHRARAGFDHRYGHLIRRGGRR